MIDIPVQLTHRLSEMHQNLCWIDEQNPKSQTITAIMSLVKDCNSPPESLELTQKPSIEDSGKKHLRHDSQEIRERLGLDGF